MTGNSYIDSQQFKPAYTASGRLGNSLPQCIRLIDKTRQDWPSRNVFLLDALRFTPAILRKIVHEDAAKV